MLRICSYSAIRKMLFTCWEDIEVEVFRLYDKVNACDYTSTRLEIMIEFSYILFAMHTNETQFLSI